MIELFIHIGLPKTGTTSLQNYLANNSQKLASQGILYPTIYRPYNAPAHHAIPWEICGDITINSPFYQRDFNEYIKEQSQNFNKIVISSEFFWSAFFLQPEKTVNFFQELSKNFPVNIIITLREFSQLVNSSCTQHIKTFYAAVLNIDGHVQVLIEQGIKNFSTLVSMSKFIAPENFRLIDTTNKELTIEKFLSIINMDSSSLPNTLVKDNQKPSLEVLRVLWNLNNKYPNLKDFTPDQKASILRAVSQNIKEHSKTSYSLLSPEKNLEINHEVLPLFEELNSASIDDISSLITTMKTKAVYSEQEANQIMKNVEYIYTPLSLKETSETLTFLINTIRNKK